MSTQKTQNRKIEFFDGVTAIDLEGFSMLPTLKTGDVVLVKSQTDIKPGEIAVISSFGKLVVHRIVANVKIGDTILYIHRGDNIELFNSPGIASANQILGIVTGLPKKLVMTPVVTLLVNLLRLGAILSFIGIYPRRALRENWTPKLYNNTLNILHSFGW